MSAILSADDLNDFISPGVACIKPIETLPVEQVDNSVGLSHCVIDGRILTLARTHTKSPPKRRPLLQNHPHPRRYRLRIASHAQGALQARKPCWSRCNRIRRSLQLSIHTHRYAHHGWHTTGRMGSRMGQQTESTAAILREDYSWQASRRRRAQV